MHIWVFKLVKYKEVVTINIKIVELSRTEKGYDWNEAQREAPRVAVSILFFDLCVSYKNIHLSWPSFYFYFCIYGFFNNKTTFIKPCQIDLFCIYFQKKEKEPVPGCYKRHLWAQRKK